MAEETKKSKGGSKLSRSEITTIRLDPKLRYLAELAARKQRRTLSSFIEWAIEDTLGRFPLKEGPDWLTSVMSEAETLWDVDPPDRFARLALSYPDLLTHDEQVMWKLVRENGYFWRGRFSSSTKEWTWQVNLDSLVLVRLRERWDIIQAVAAGNQPATELPSWIRKQPEKASGFDDMDSEIPF